MAANPKPIPEGYHAVTVCLVVDDVPGAIDFYKLAFRAREICRFAGPDGKLMHAEVQIGDTRLMLGPACPDSKALPPSQLEGTTCWLYLYVPDADAAYEQAVNAGANVTEPVADMFWGDRVGQVTDPSGHRWMLATHIEDLSEKEMRRRAEEFFAAHT